MMGTNEFLAADAARWQFAVKNKCFPVIAQDGQTWVVWTRGKDFKRRAFMGTTPSEAMDFAMAGSPHTSDGEVEKP